MAGVPLRLRSPSWAESPPIGFEPAGVIDGNVDQWRNPILDGQRKAPIGGGIYSASRRCAQVSPRGVRCDGFTVA